MSNPGNTGYKGYKMSKVTAIVPKEQTVEIQLECGHSYTIYPFSNMTPQEYALDMQQTRIRPWVIGKTRVKCSEQH